MINKFNPCQYIELIEDSKISSLQKYISKEKEFITNVIKNKDKDVIDLGSGYGRLLELLVNYGRKNIFIELNSQMFAELHNRSFWTRNTQVINGDITLLDKYEYKDISNPLFLLTQNTIGVVEGGWKKAIEALKRVFIGHKREVIISFLKQSALENEGIKIYEELSPMLGILDHEKTDFNNGIFVAQGGYTAKWWKEEDINDLKRLLKALEINQLEGEIYKIIHLSF